MITEQQRATIRRLFFAEHWKIGTIASELGIHHDAVELALEPRRFVNRRFAATAHLLEPFKPFIADTLKQYPRLRATRILQMVEARGYRGSVTTLRRYLRKVRPVPKHEAFFRLSVLPGEQAQVDWGSFGKIRIGRFERLLSCFVMVLMWSRATFARFTLDQTLESFLRCHVAAFERFGGAPRTALYDNLKSVVIERQGDLIRFHPKILELAGHYHFEPKPVAQARGNEKGGVERRIRFIRESFFAARSFTSVDDLNQQLDQWIERIAHTRKVPGDSEHTVAQAFEQEQALLLPLPAHRFGTDFVRPVCSGKTPYVRFDRNDYTIPHTLVRKPLTLVASDRSVRILDGQQEVAHHVRCWERGRQIETEQHLAELAAEKRKGRHHGREQSRPPHSQAAAHRKTSGREDGWRNMRVGELVRDGEGPQRVLRKDVSAHLAGRTWQSGKALRRAVGAAVDIRAAPPPFRRGRLRSLSTLTVPLNRSKEEPRASIPRAERTKVNGAVTKRPIAPRTAMPSLGSVPSPSPPIRTELTRRTTSTIEEAIAHYVAERQAKRARGIVR